MSDRTPDFDELVAADDPERARLLGAHELLVAAGRPRSCRRRSRRRLRSHTAPCAPCTARRYTAVAAIAIAATVLFGIGYAVGGRDAPASPVQTIAMSGRRRRDRVDRPARQGRRRGTGR